MAKEQLSDEEKLSKPKHGNTRLPFGLCKRYGIELPEGAEPRDAWDALASKGIFPSQVYKDLLNGKRFANEKKSRMDKDALGNRKNGDITKSTEQIKNQLGGSSQSRTIAGVKLGKPMSFDEADGGKANPNYMRSRLFHINCQTCVVANELRRRGYDVEALGRTIKEQDDLAIDSRAWSNPNGAVDFINSTANTAIKFYKFLDAEVADGRYFLSFITKGQTSRIKINAHIVCVERENGDIRIFDPQSNRKYSGRDQTLRYLKEAAKFNVTRHYHSYFLPPKLLRVDNLDINETLVSKIVKESK